MKKVAINENELAERWGLSPKTLQRWRSEGRGPRYLKLSKRVTYLMKEILAFEMESMHSATWEKGSDGHTSIWVSFRSAPTNREQKRIERGRNWAKLASK